VSGATAHLHGFVPGPLQAYNDDEMLATSERFYRSGFGIAFLCSTKTIEFEVENGCKRRTFAVCYFCYIFEVINTFNPKAALDKTKTVGRSNSTGVRPRPVGVRGRSPNVAVILRLFKKYAFFAIVWSKFLLKSAFLNG